MTLPGPRITYEDYKLLPEESRYEVIAGQLMMTPAPNARHQRVFSRLFVRLTSFIESKQVGEVLPAPFDVILSEHNVVQPDILFIAKERLHIIDPLGGAHGAPDARTVAVLTQTTAGLEPWRSFPAGDTLTSPLLSGLAIALSDIFKD